MTHRKKKRASLKWSVFATFASFTLLIIASLWVAQIFLFGYFHYWDVKNRMATAAYQLSAYVGDAPLEERMETVAETEKACILVYRLDGETVTLVSDYKESPMCVVHRFDSAHVRGLADRAKTEEGLLQIRLSDLVRENEGRRMEDESETDRLITALLVENNRESYIILMDASLYPVESTVMTLRYQLVHISVALALISIILSVILSNYVAAPIESINKKAKELSHGKFESISLDRYYRESEELAETLSQVADELSKVERLQSELIANISHDLRTPLTMIIGYGEVMRDIEGENTPENIQVIIDEATRLSVLVNDLLEISRIQGGSAEKKDEVFDFSALVNETVDRYRRLKENSGFEFLSEVADGILIRGDRMKLSQVLCNLINNAINYSANERLITVRLERLERTARLSVADRGIGIAPEDIENVWQRYYKVDKVHRRSVVGSGLGLSIVREILELHGARYGVRSKLGEGSVFWFELPIYEQPSALEEKNPSNS